MSTEVPVREFRFGQGKISGVLATTLGLMGFGAVLCLLFPELLTTPEMRALYPMRWMRGLIQLVLAAAFLLGLTSVILSRRKRLGVVGMGLSLTATLMGGAQIEVDSALAESNYIGLDWFLLDLFLLALIFVPLERTFARLKEQRVFRKGWKTDVAHFGISHLLIQVTVLLTMVPAALFFHRLVSPAFQARVAAQPIALQFVEALFLADLFAYLAHRAFHAIPFLWRFHAIHHSSESMDWLAGSRLHLVDIVVTRAFGFIPLYIIGFSNSATYAYLVFASFQAVFIHSNVRFQLKPLHRLLATPQFHHWHHSADPEALNKNFAVHLPLIDIIFGTYHLPKHRWPEIYGIEGNPVPDGYLKQVLYPFRRRKP